MGAGVTPQAERRALQAVILAGGCVPVGAGLIGILAGPGAFAAAEASPTLSSHVAYLSGLLLAIGLGFWSCIPRVEVRGHRIRLLAAIVVVGGLARLLALATTGVPQTPHLLALVMELGVTPGIALWQARVASRLPRPPLRRATSR